MAKRHTRREPRASRPHAALTAVPHTSRAHFTDRRESSAQALADEISVFDSRAIDRLVAGQGGGILPSITDIAIDFVRMLMEADQRDAALIADHVVANPQATVINPFGPDSLRARRMSVIRLASRLCRSRMEQAGLNSVRRRSLAEPRADRVKAIREAGRLLEDRYPLLEARFDYDVERGREQTIAALARRKPSGRSTKPDDRKRECLLKHHRFDGKTCRHWGPIAAKDLAKKVGVTPPTITEFFKKYFGGHRNYKRLCHLHNAEALNNALQTLKGDGLISRRVVTAGLGEIEARRPKPSDRQRKRPPPTDD